MAASAFQNDPAIACRRSTLYGIPYRLVLCLFLLPAALSDTAILPIAGELQLVANTFRVEGCK